MQLGVRCMAVRVVVGVNYSVLEGGSTSLRADLADALKARPANYFAVRRISDGNAAGIVPDGARLSCLPSWWMDSLLQPEQWPVPYWSAASSNVVPANTASTIL